MKVKMRNNLVGRYEQVLPGEMAAEDDNGKQTITFLQSIEDKEIELVFTGGDAFEESDDNIWLPDVLWDKI